MREKKIKKKTSLFSGVFFVAYLAFTHIPNDNIGLKKCHDTYVLHTIIDIFKVSHYILQFSLQCLFDLTKGHDEHLCLVNFNKMLTW